MEGYEWTIGALNAVVTFLLLQGANRLCARPGGLLRTALGALLNGIYGGLCAVPALRFLSGDGWRLLFLGLTVFISFGLCRSALRQGSVFLLLHFAAEGLGRGLGDRSPATLAAGALCVFALCLLGARGEIGSRLIPVELHYGGKHLRLTALRDTGHTLTDPVTGSSVLVVSADAAQKLTGLTPGQLQRPIETMGALPGLRLIPYRAVGQENGLMLAMRVQNAKIGPWQGSALVAFAPAGLGENYQALTGGYA